SNIIISFNSNLNLTEIINSSAIIIKKRIRPIPFLISNSNRIFIMNKFTIIIRLTKITSFNFSYKSIIVFIYELKNYKICFISISLSVLYIYLLSLGGLPILINYN
uniref:Uncharacterized protein n=1 Tax=Glossina morsitans morsitans TaxID=37546 RepID=A0A1B0FBW7_GLOMM